MVIVSVEDVPWATGDCSWSRASHPMLPSTTPILYGTQLLIRSNHVLEAQIIDYCLVQHQALVMHVFDHNLGTPSQKRRTDNAIYSANEGETRDDAHEYAWTNLLIFFCIFAIIRIFSFHRKTKVYSSFLFEHSGLDSAMCPHPLLCVFIPDCLRAHCTCCALKLNSLQNRSIITCCCIFQQIHDFWESEKPRRTDEQKKNICLYTSFFNKLVVLFSNGSVLPPHELAGCVNLSMLIEQKGQSILSFSKPANDFFRSLGVTLTPKATVSLTTCTRTMLASSPCRRNILISLQTAKAKGMQHQDLTCKKTEYGILDKLECPPSQQWWQMKISFGIPY